jgi:hypothetical protein
MGTAAAIVFKLGIVFLFLSTIIILSLYGESGDLRRILPGRRRFGRWRNLRLRRHKT